MSEDENKKQVIAAHRLMDKFLKDVMKSKISIAPIVMTSVMFKTAGILLADYCDTYHMEFKDQLKIQFDNLDRLSSEGKL